MNLHIKAYQLNHWLLSLYGFKYLHYSVTLLSRGWNLFSGVCSDLDIDISQTLTKTVLKDIFFCKHIHLDISQLLDKIFLPFKEQK